MRVLLLLVGALVLAAGCGGEDDDTRPITSSRDCFALWNGSGNEANRARIAEEAEFGVAVVGRFTQIADFGEGADESDRAGAEREGCSYLFHTHDRYLTFSGMWEDDEFQFGTPPTIAGPWNPQQDLNTDDNATVSGDGAITKRAPPEAPPAGREPTVGGLEPPPPAWIETDRGSFWLGYSSFCWRSGCADYIAPSCSKSPHVPKVVVGRGEIVHVHLGFSPNQVSLASFAEEGRSEPAELERHVAGQEVAWRVERAGAFALMAHARGGGDASYVACVELDS